MSEFKNKALDLLPREMMMKASSAEELSDDALLAVLLKTGSVGCDVVELARRLIDAFGSIKNLVAADWRQIENRILDYNMANPKRPVRGVGKVKCLELAAAFELGRRGNRLSFVELVQMRVITPDDAYKVFLGVGMPSLEREVFYVLPLDVRNQPKSLPIAISSGSAASAAVDVSAVFREAIRWNARSIVVAHNHPSGDPTPSEEDVQLTQALRNAADVLKIGLLDHLVVGASDSAAGRGFVSIFEVGL